MRGCVAMATINIAFGLELAELQWVALRRSTSHFNARMTGRCLEQLVLAKKESEYCVRADEIEKA